MKRLLNFNGRPCQIVGGTRVRAANPKWGWVQKVSIRFLDGEYPSTEQVPIGQLRTKAKAIRTSEAIYWRRVDALIQLGMDVQRAKDQARAELSKGLLTGVGI